MPDLPLTLLSDLIPLIAREERVAGLLQALANSARLHVTPVPGTARRALAAAVASSGATVLLVAATPDAAARLHADIGCWLGDQTLLFPPTDALPYEHMSPDIGIVAQRLQVLQRIQHEPCLIVTSAKALVQPTLTPAELQHALRTLRQGTRHEMRTLLEHWLGLGYRAAPTAEQPGEISSRGGIIDIYPPTSERPVRLEFWGDELESLRMYDPLT